MDGGAWWAAVHGVAESDMIEWLHFHFSLSCTGEGNGNPLQCSCLENPRDGGAWWAAVYGVAQSRTRLKRLSNSSSSINGLLKINGCDPSLHNHRTDLKGSFPAIENFPLWFQRVLFWMLHTMHSSPSATVHSVLQQSLLQDMEIPKHLKILEDSLKSHLVPVS